MRFNVNRSPSPFLKRLSRIFFNSILPSTSNICFLQKCSYSSSRSYYDTLEVSRNASQEEIKKAFITLSKKYHPDMTGQNKLAEKKFIDVKEAYDTLRDESKRREYDATIYVDQDQRPKHGYQSWDNSTQQQYYKKNYYTPEDFDRIWRTMQQNPDFRRANRELWEEIMIKRNQAYREHTRKRNDRWNQGNDASSAESIYDRWKTNNPLSSMLNNIIIIYAVFYVLTHIFRPPAHHSIRRHYSGTDIPIDDETPPQSLEEERRQMRERIEKIMKKPPTY